MSHHYKQIKLGKRLAKIAQLVTDSDTQVWDCCCDHGLLGLHLLTAHQTRFVHFVDCVPSLIDAVSEQLVARKLVSRSRTYCIDAGNLPISTDAAQLIIIAGVGGDLMASIVAQISRQYPDKSLEFILCPVRHQVDLRDTLRALQFSLINEHLVFENGRYYEVMRVSNQINQTRTITRFGEAIWGANGAESYHHAIAYLQQNKQHFERMRASDRENTDDILNGYNQIKITPF